MTTKVTAHAGCEGTQAGSRENIETALKSGADVIEMDLRALGDQLYLSHDPLQTDHLDAYLTFRQALELLQDCCAEINCDLKEAGVLRIALKILREMDMQERAFFTGEIDECHKAKEAGCRCFRNVEHYSFVEAGKQLSEQEVRRLIQLYQTDSEKHLTGFNVEYGMLTPEAIRLFAKERIPISCWLVDDEQAIRQLLRENISYITTDRVKYAVSQRELLS